MADSTEDIWSNWLRKQKFIGHDRDEEAWDRLNRYREQVLDNAAPVEGEVLLDVGAGDGLIAFGALDRIGQSGQVIFSDISEELLNRSRSLAEEMGVHDQCRFVRAPAEDLSAIADASVDVVTTRSVLIYVEDKQRAFSEFYRVLKPGGRLSIFEPVNSFLAEMSERPNTFWQYDMDEVTDLDVEPLPALAEKVREVQWQAQSSGGRAASMDFDERDLFAFAEQAGFDDIHLELSAWKTHKTSSEDWASFVTGAWSPEVPTIEEAMDEALTVDERERFTRNLRPLVESETAPQDERGVTAYLWGGKP